MVQDIFVDTKFGRLHALEAGSGEPLILLHSNGGSAYEYEHVIEPLAEKYRVIAWDMPGQGDSDPLFKYVSVHDYADAVIAFMDGLGIDKAHILGASIGGAICVALGANYPARIKKNFIIECPYRSAAEWQGNWANTEANYCPATQTLERIKPRLRNATPELLTRWNIDRSKAGSKTCLNVMWALRQYDIEADLKQLGPNQILVFGDKSPTVGKIEKYKATLGAPHVHVIEDCGHFPMIDDPEQFVRIIEQELKAHQQ